METSLWEIKGILKIALYLNKLIGRIQKSKLIFEFTLIPKEICFL